MARPQLHESRLIGSKAAPGISRHVAVSVVGNVFAPLSALATAPILAQSLGVDGRGEVAAATAPLLLATTVATFGLPSAVTYVLARVPDLRRRVTARAAVMLCVAGVTLTALVAVASRWLGGGSSTLASIIALAGCAIVPGLLAALLQAMAAGARLWGRVAVERFVTSALRLLAVLALAATGELTVVSAALTLATTPLLGALVYLPLLRRRRVLREHDALGQATLPLDPGDPAGTDSLAATLEAALPPEGGYRHLLDYGLRVWLGSVAGIVLSRLDQALMVPLSGAAALGVYVVAASIADLPLVVNSAVRDVLFSAQVAEARVGTLVETPASAQASTAVEPSASMQAARGGEQVDGDHIERRLPDHRAPLDAHDRLEAAARLSTLVVTLVVLAVAVPLPWLVPAVFGREFVGAVPVCWLLLAGVVVGNAGSVAGAGLSARGRPGLRSAALAVACGVNAVLVVMLVPRWGALGAAGATAVGSLLAGWLAVVALARLSGRSPLGYLGVRRSDLKLLAGAAAGAVGRRR